MSYGEKKYKATQALPPVHGLFAALFWYSMQVSCTYNIHRGLQYVQLELEQ